jgi:hypothetical protein
MLLGSRDISFFIQIHEKGKNALVPSPRGESLTTQQVAPCGSPRWVRSPPTACHLSYREGLEISLLGRILPFLKHLTHNFSFPVDIKNIVYFPNFNLTNSRFQQ